MTIADLITLLRVLLTPLVMVLWMNPSPASHELGLGVFIAAGVTDYIDGRVARSSRQTTAFGAYLDPLADKILVLGVGLAELRMGLLPVWLLFFLLLRELAVTGLRSVLPTGKTMPASVLAKWKTTSQLVALAASAVLSGVWPWVFWTIALVLTAWTGGEYFWQHWPRMAPSTRIDKH